DLEEGVLRGRSGVGGRRTVPRRGTRLKVAALGFILGASLLIAQDREETPTFRTEVKLVNVFTGVISEQNGRLLGDLSKENFAIYEDGIPQRIAVFERDTVLPLSIVLAIDTSL